MERLNVEWAVSTKPKWDALETGVWRLEWVGGREEW